MDRVRNFDFRGYSATWGLSIKLRTEDGRSLQILDKVGQLQDAISEGAVSFLTTEYKYMGVFSVSETLSMSALRCGPAKRAMAATGDLPRH